MLNTYKFNTKFSIISDHFKLVNLFYDLHHIQVGVKKKQKKTEVQKKSIKFNINGIIGPFQTIYTYRDLPAQRI